MSVCADADVVLGVPIDEHADASSSTTAVPSSTATSVYSARLTLSQRATHARSLVQSAQAFVVFGGYLRLREASREWRMKTWYCALLRTQLYVYPTQRDATRATNLVQRVTIASQSTAPSNGQGRFHTYKHAFTFRTTRGTTFFCSAASENERAQWLEQLMQAGGEDAVRSKDSIPCNTKGDDDDVTDTETTTTTTTATTTTDRGSRQESGESVDQSQRTVSSRDAASFLLTSSSLSDGSTTTTATTTNGTGCFACGTAFGLLRRHRRTCRSCARYFCRAHCSQYAAGVDTAACDASLTSAPSSSSSSSFSTSSSTATSSTSTSTTLRSRVCDACSHRQHFISFLDTFTATAIRLMRHDSVNVATVAATPPSLLAEDEGEESEQDQKRHAKMHKELAIIVSTPTSYTVLNVLCLLKKYAHVPWMFTRALCLLLPLYERNPSALEEYWTQFLILYVPLLALREPFSPSMQYFLRFVSAVCRRSNAFALRTVWECLAFSEDARQQDDHLTRSYLTLLMIACSSGDGSSSYVLRHLLADAPRAQVEAITNSLHDFLGIRSVLRDEIPKSLAARWFNALCQHDMDVAKKLVLGAADELEPDVLLRVLDPSQTDYLALLTRHFVRLPIGVFAVEDECEFEEEDTTFMYQQEIEFDAQAAFVEQLTAISDRLRHVLPVAKRSDVLKEELQALDQQHLARDGGGDTIPIHAPLLGAGGGTILHKLRLLRVVPDEGKVFSTRSRAPTMMVFEACPVGGTRPLAATLRDSIIRGIPVRPEDTDDDPLEGELVVSAQLVSKRLRANSRSAIAHKDSAMLDALLCGNDDATSSGSNSGSGSGGSDVDDANNTTSDDSGLPPDELLVQEARETYEDSTLGQLMTSFRGGDSSAARSKWKRAIHAASPFRDVKGWTVVSLIAKSHDDLRQEVFAMQLMRNLVEIFETNDLHRLHLRPYEIMCTGANVGLIETLTDAQSVDAVKKQYGSLAEYFAELFGSPSSARYQAAQNAFVTSVAASSLYCYLFQIKDRHNGNIMLDQRGHIMHIDFGFMMGSAPGGSFSLEDAPFKLTREMVEIMGGLDSKGYQDFGALFLEGFLAVRREYIKIVTLLHLTAQNSPYPCFQNTPPRHILRSFRERLFLADSDDVARTKIRRLIEKSYNHWGTRQYDRFQYSSNGIMP